MLTVLLILVIPMLALSSFAVAACMMSARINSRDDAAGYETPLCRESGRLAPQTARLSTAK